MFTRCYFIKKLDILVCLFNNFVVSISVKYFFFLSNKRVAMNKGSLEEANRMLNLALEELNFIADGAQQKSGVEIAKTILQTKRKMSNNENTASEKANVAVSSVQTLNWDSSMNDWMDYGNENHRDSGTSSSDGMPTSDAPTSSTTSSSISIFDALLQAIDRNEISSKPDLETRLKIMNWLCTTEEINKILKKTVLLQENVRYASYWDSDIGIVIVRH
ncbi:hypothetical protein ACH3XW_50175 [Acanthocheilonema viteae]